MIENNFDLVTVEKCKDDLNSLSLMVNDLLHGIGPQKIAKRDVEVLIRSFENVVKLSGMYNDVVEQAIRDKEVVTSNPQKYISHNLSNACNLTEIVYNKYKNLSRFDK